MIRRWLAYGGEWFFGSVDSRYYAILRISIGGLALLRLISLLYFSNALFSSDSWLEKAQHDVAGLSSAVYGWNPFSWSASVYWPVVVFCIFIVVSFSLMIGRYSRFSALFCYLAFVSIRHRNLALSYGGDSVLANFLLFLSFTRCGSRWSLDQHIQGDRGQKTRGIFVEAWPLRMLQIIICLIYFVAGLAKIISGDWLEAGGLDLILRNPFYSRWDFRDFLSHASVRILVGGLSIFIPLWEITFPLGIVFRRSRNVYLAAAITMHLATVFLLKAQFFGEIMLVSLLVFASPSFLDRLAQWAQLITEKVVHWTRLRVTIEPPTT